MNLARPKILLAMVVTAGLVIAATTLPSATAAPPAARSTGCGKQATPTGDYEIVSGGLTRTYRLHVPAKYNPVKATPLILVYQGRGKTGAQPEAFSDLSSSTRSLPTPTV